MSTKSDVINDAYSKLRISGLTVIATPEDQQKALNRLERFMAHLVSRNICIGYNFTDTLDPNDPTGVSEQHFEMMSSNLAVKLIPDFGKEVPPVLGFQASGELSTVSSFVAARDARETQYPTRQPIGSGNEYRYGNRYQRYYRPEILPDPGCTSNELGIDEINDYVEAYKAYLKGEVIFSYVITATTGLSIESDSNTDDLVNYRIKAVGPSTTGGYQQVKIVVTTDTGRVDTRLINFTIFTEKLVGTI